MKTCRILFVNSDPREIETMEHVVHRLGNDVSVYAVRSGKEALAALMGSSGDAMKPDLIIASSVLPDMSTFELMSIVRKYYSLVNLKFYLLTDRAEDSDHSHDPFLVDGYLHRPLRNDLRTIRSVSRLVDGTDTLRLAMLIGVATHSIRHKTWGILQQKFAALVHPFTPAAKIALCASCAAVPCAVVVTMSNPEPASVKYISVTPGPLADPSAIELIQTPAVNEPEVTVEAPEPVAEKKEMNESPVPVVRDTISVKVIQPDTTIHKKKFSIGVRPVNP